MESHLADTTAGKHGSGPGPARSKCSNQFLSGLTLRHQLSSSRPSATFYRRTCEALHS